MKRTLIIAILCGAMVAMFSAPAQAIDAKKKSGSQATARPDSTGAKVEAKSKPANTKSLLERLKKDVRESSQNSQSGKYDNYIDANRDGVDDRLQVKKGAIEATSEKPARQEKPVADDSVRTRSKRTPR